ncbi:two-component system response regulator NarL [Pseudomonas aeruginosa]|uniref:two-component system response regulator NarL n=14 Tax=Gammaproteobacteria TaxID=1236 RepID=UPI003D6F7E92
MNKATAPDADQRDRFFGGSDRAGKPILRRSLVVRFGCYLTLLVSLALIGMFSALLFADYTHQDAAVINHAGSLRMLTYRVALEPSLEGRQALLGTIGERLDSGDIRRLLQRQDADDPIRQLHQELREGLARLDPRALPGRAVLDAYVGDIDRFVGILQAKAERRSQLLSTVQGLCLFLSLLVVFVTLYDLSYHVIGPLRELTSTARRLGRGELDARVTYSGEEALRLAAELDPDMSLLDLNMKGMNGLDTLRALREAGVDARIVVFTVSDDKGDVVNVLRAGADGYLLKDMEPERLLEHIRQAATGQMTLSPQLTQILAQALRGDDRSKSLDELTERERQILRQIAHGYSNKMIARKLDITEGTVKVHVKRVLHKLGMRSRVEAAVWAVENDLV